MKILRRPEKRVGFFDFIRLFLFGTRRVSAESEFGRQLLIDSDRRAKQLARVGRAAGYIVII